ncbi:efflux RND transporter periplasmic adaptor subunit [Novosphingobium album (ex Liu et al. 2023)]|uniref:efflux RND transporter periplasmic adaptor subunit n=1 Tax=Novosphingobium album (ex Liu et al. 2023) TaxID=3031130 RepID=UPI0023AFB0F9|nr:efflux RND transporter periplasmic adaptor subunit [Novosphingobium album (ex Liu et al. 2023)]
MTAVVLLAGCGGTAERDPRTEAPLVQIAIARPAGEASRSFTGVVTARVQSDVGFRVGGKVVERLVNAGDRVRRGQALMRIDPTDLGLALAVQRETVTAARAQAVQAAAEERRLRGLDKEGAITAQAYDQAKAAADSARAQLAAAEAAARAAGNARDYAVLRADADGVVVETLAEPGQVVSAGQPVMRVAQAGPREASVSLPETVRPAIGSMAIATIESGAAASPARLRQLSAAADPRTRTFDARYVLSGAAAQAPLGRTVSVALPAPRDEGIVVPLGALWNPGSGPGVWVLPPGRDQVRWRRVRVARLDAETAVVAAGLRANERVVGLGADQLHAGQTIRVHAAEGTR